MTTTRLAIVCDLDVLRDLMREFVDDVEQDEDLKMQLNWTFETFLQWLRQRQQRTETTDETEGNQTNKV